MRNYKTFLFLDLSDLVGGKSIPFQQPAQGFFLNKGEFKTLSFLIKLYIVDACLHSAWFHKKISILLP